MPLAVLSFDSGESSLYVRSFRIEDGMSRPFAITVTAVSPNQLDLETIVGCGAALALDAGPVDGHADARRWGGVCQHIAQIHAEPTGLSTYEIAIRPMLWLLTQRRGYRVFEHLTIPDIVERVLAPYRITPTWRIDRARYPKLWYRVQYGESDYHFFCRMLEEAGITFWFAPSGKGDVAAATDLILGDAPEKAAPRTPALPWTDNPNTAVKHEEVTELQLAHEVRPGGYTIRDFDFRRPAFGLSGEADRASAPETDLEQIHYQPGAFLVETPASAAVPPAGDTPAADDKAIARYDDKLGADRAARALAGARMGRRSVSLRTSVLDLGPGMVFFVARHPHAEISADAGLVVIEQTVEGTIDGDLTMRLRAVFTDVAYRPPLVTQRPMAEGVQSAIIVGPEGQEIHTDEFGRVRVQFPWDREGKNDDDSSCWVRVSQGWAGTGFGMVNLPRVGQEVLVGFLAGDPDQPVVVGRVFNAQNPVPYPLPEHRTRSTWKSCSSPGGGGFNEIMFEDLAARELFWIQAERDLRRLVKNDETITVGRDRQKLVKRNETEVVNGTRTEVTLQDRTEVTHGDRTTVVRGNREVLVKRDAVLRVEGDRVIYVGGDQHLMVMGTKRERVERDRHVLVRGNRSEQVGGTYGLTAGSHQIACGSQAVGAGTIHLQAASKIVIEAPDVTLKAAGGFIHIHGGGVEIKGATVKINSGGSAGSLGGGGGGHPEKPIEAKVDLPTIPAPDDVSATRLGPGR